MELHERIKQLRLDLGLTQQQYADQLGVSRDTVNNLERGRMQIKEMYLHLICRTYRVNYFWLTEGKGEIFIEVPEIILDEAVEKYGLDEQDKELIEGYVKLPLEVRKGLKKYLMDVFKKVPE